MEDITTIPGRALNGRRIPDIADVHADAVVVVHAATQLSCLASSRLRIRISRQSLAKSRLVIAFRRNPFRL